MEQKNILITILVIGLAATSIILAINMKNGNTVITGGNEQKTNTISVTGEGKVSTQADKAEIYAKINTEGSTASAAKDSNTQLSNKVIDALTSAGVKKSDIETSYYYLNKKQEWDENQKKIVDKGYELNHVIKITTTNLDKVGDLVDIAVNAGANGIDSVSFGLSDAKQKDISKEALKIASTNGEDKANAIADSMNLNIGKLVTASESSFSYIPYVVSNVAYKEMGSAPQILPQNLEITASVMLTYEIN